MKKVKIFGIVLICALFCFSALVACAGDGLDVSGSQNAQTNDQADEADGEAGGTSGTNSAEGANSTEETNSEEEPSPPDDEEDDLPQAGSSETDEYVPEPLSLEHDLGISVDGQWFPIFQDVSGLLSALGGNYELSVAPSCVFEGEDKEFAFDGFFVFTNPDGDWGERDIWYSIYVENDTLTTARGITVGHSLEEVLANYGSRFFWEGDTVLTYSISGIQGDIASPCIMFIFRDNHVISFEIYYPTNVT